ncbi:hypothetical protein QQP08_005376 [Theobroma cacao]|nr:hypothetical protein QQP08_005376 [Theobroma cacao]
MKRLQIPQPPLLLCFCDSGTGLSSFAQLAPYKIKAQHMDWCFGNGIEDLVVPMDQELADRLPSPESWSKWGYYAPGNFESSNKCFVVDENLTCEELKFNGRFCYGTEFETSADAKDPSSFPSVCGGLSEESLNQAPLSYPQPDYELDDFGRFQQMDDIFLSSLLEDLLGSEDLQKSVCFSPEDQCGRVPADYLLTDVSLDSQTISKNEHGMGSAKYLKTHAFSPSMTLEKEIPALRFKPRKSGLKNSPSVKIEKHHVMISTLNQFFKSQSEAEYFLEKYIKNKFQKFFTSDETSFVAYKSLLRSPVPATHLANIWHKNQTSSKPCQIYHHRRLFSCQSFFKESFIRISYNFLPSAVTRNRTGDIFLSELMFQPFLYKAVLGHKRWTHYLLNIIRFIFVIQEDCIQPNCSLSDCCIPSSWDILSKLNAPLAKILAPPERNSETGFVSEGISLEESVLQELEMVTVQLSNKTRICFRDAFYRLAKNSKQNPVVINQHGNVCVRTHAPMWIVSEEKMRSGRKETTESETNSIDRAIANLTFNNMETNVRDFPIATPAKSKQHAIRVTGQKNNSSNQSGIHYFPRSSVASTDAEVPFLVHKRSQMRMAGHE